MDEYDFEIDRVLKEITACKAKLVGLQFPEGLKIHAVRIAREIEKASKAKTVTFIDPVYGACDTKEKEARVLKIDVLVHFGHTDMKPKLCE